MDEPTNHLDLDSSEALIKALEQYEGTLMFVSHNRSFLNHLATHVWEVRDRKVTPYPGNLDDYLYHLQQEEAAKDADGGDGLATRSVGGDGAAAKPLSEKERKRAEAEARQRRSQVEGPIKKEIAALEARIATLETAAKQHEAALADPDLYNDFARARPIMDAHQAGKAELEELYAKWEAAQEKLAQVS
jgi:ATP-binding cassette subfamily F protein 3